MPGQKIKGGVADKYSVEDLAKMHGVTVDDIQKELTAGIEVEMEHTNSESKAREIAMDHISEHPKYYTDPSRFDMDYWRLRNTSGGAGNCSKGGNICYI